MTTDVTTITLDNLLEAERGLEGIATHTPLIPLPIPGITHDIRLKAEFAQPIGAFKIRGAWTAMRRLDPVARSRGVVTSSSGNHGLGIAFAAQRLGIRAVIVMPESAPGIKVDGVRRFGGEVILAGKKRGPEQTAAAEAFAREQGLTMIPPFDHPDVIAGQGTCAMEILADWPEVETIVSPVGGGGLLAGTCSAVRARAEPGRPAIRVIAVEPAGIPKLSAAINAGRPTTLPGGESLADGLLGKSIGTITWPLIRDTVSQVVGVTDDEIRAAVRWLSSRNLRVEPSGAVTTAAMLAGRIGETGATALIATGGNVDPKRFEELIG